MHLTTRGMELSAEIKDFVGRRVHFSFGRFAGKVKHLSIRLADANGPRGGIDQCCDVRVHTGLGQRIIVHERQSDIYTAVALAIERAERAVQRQMSLESIARNRRASPRSFQFGD